MDKLSKKNKFSSQKRDLCLLWILIICVFLFSMSIIPMYFTRNDFDNVNKIFGMMFWIPLILSVIIQCLLWINYKRWFKKHGVKRKKKRNPGIIAFLANDYAKISDIGTLVMIIVTIVVFNLSDGILCYITLSFLIFFFYMHCILNGKIYYHVLNQDKILYRLIRKKERGTRKDESIKNKNV